MNLSERNKDTIYNILLLAGFIVILFLTFYKLGYASLRDWDEARHGVNAYELMQSGDWIVTTYGYVKDYWNLKPPLSEWLIISGYKIFGFNALGLRFYSAVSHVITVVICFMFVRKVFGKLAALFTIYGFAAWKTFYGFHYARFGDADAFFILLYVTSILSLYLMWKNKSFVYISCLCVSLSFLAKGMHAGIIAVSIFIAVFATGYIKRLSIKDIAICILLAVGPIAMWAVVRVYIDGTYFLHQMFFYDVVARSSRTIEGHIGGPLFYVKNFLITKYVWVLLFFITSFFVFKKNDKDKVPLLALCSGIIVPFLLFSAVKSKFDWYTWCTYPLIIILASAGFSVLFDRLKSQILKVGLVLSVIVVSCLFAYKNVANIYHINKTNQLADSAQSLIVGQKLGDKQSIFLHDNNGNGKWTQSAFLTLELYGDLIPKNGGIEEFKKQSNVYIMVANNKMDSALSKHKIINKGKYYTLLIKK